MNRSELDALLARELDRRVELFAAAEPDVMELRAALHSLRGSAAMAGHADLSLLLAHLSARLKAGDRDAAAEGAALLREAAARLRQGREPFASRWPEPPAWLGPGRIEPEHRSEYLATLRDRLAELDRLAQSSDEPAQVQALAARCVHSIKGAAAAVGDDPIAWYCHGLESALRRAAQAPGQARVLAELDRHRGVIALLLEDAAGALAALRVAAPGTGRQSAPPASRRPSGAPGVGEDDTGERTVRVHGGALDRVLERVERIHVVRDELGGAASDAQALSLRLRELRRELHEALRLIGPPRPWGAPAAALSRIEHVARSLGEGADESLQAALACRRGAESLGHDGADIRREIAQVRRTTLQRVLGRVAEAVERIASREERLVRVVVSGADAPIDREVAERLVDPLMQLARNAVAHGLEAPAERAERGKSPMGTLLLSAERAGDWLRIVCEDDGRGVDVARIRQLAVERELITEEASRAASDDELLALLFAPGLTTRSEADLLAGRGVGLDLAQAVVRRLGGSIRLMSRPGSGLTATVEIPGERGIVEVLWVQAAGIPLALPLGFTGRVGRCDPADAPVHVAACLGVPSGRSPAWSLELALRGIPTVSVGVDAVNGVEDVWIRPLPALATRSGPYAGAILRGDGAVHLVLDATLLAVRAWSMG